MMGLGYFHVFFIQDWIFDLDGKKRASVLEDFFPYPVCMLRPNLFICSKQISIPSITSLLAEQIEAPSSTYKNKNNSSLVRNLYLLL